MLAMLRAIHQSATFSIDIDVSERNVFFMGIALRERGGNGYHIQQYLSRSVGLVCKETSTYEKPWHIHNYVVYSIDFFHDVFLS